MLLVLVLVFYAIAALITVWVLWLSLYRPWWFRPRMPVPREVRELEWEPAYQDNPIPWI